MVSSRDPAARAKLRRDVEELLLTAREDGREILTDDEALRYCAMVEELRDIDAGRVHPAPGGITFTITAPEGDPVVVFGDSMSSRDGVLIISVGARPIRMFAPGTWLQVSAAATFTPSVPPARPRLLPAISD